MKQRSLGRTGHKSTLITLGGAGFCSQFPISPEEGDIFIKMAIDHGVNHIDVAPTYGAFYGDAELRLSTWITEYRQTLFLAGKTKKRTKTEVAQELRGSLQRLKTDYFDLYQLHALDDPEELKIALGEDGAIRAVQEAQEQDLVKHIGITSHNPQNILRALEAFDFDTVLLPVNYVLRAHPEPTNDYEPVLSLAKKRNLGVIAMKSVAKGPWPNEARDYDTSYQPFTTPREVDEALWFTLSQSVTTAVTSCDQQIAKMMINAAERYIQLSEKQERELLLKASRYLPFFPRNTI